MFESKENQDNPHPASALLRSLRVLERRMLENEEKRRKTERGYTSPSVLEGFGEEDVGKRRKAKKTRTTYIPPQPFFGP
jgi:hypothetical protein